MTFDGWQALIRVGNRNHPFIVWAKDERAALITMRIVAGFLYPTGGSG